MTCREKGCRRKARPDFAWCEMHLAALYRRVFR